jgi:hypothetical protein
MFMAIDSMEMDTAHGVDEGCMQREHASTHPPRMNEAVPFEQIYLNNTYKKNTTTKQTLNQIRSLPNVGIHIQKPRQK